jgi:hypothetical protein
MKGIINMSSKKSISTQLCKSFILFALVVIFGIGATLYAKENDDIKIQLTKHSVIEYDYTARIGEGAFLGLNDGRILHVYAVFGERKGGEQISSDAGSASLYARYSSDIGITWTDETMLFSAKEDSAINIMCASLVHLDNGDIGLFYMSRKQYNNLRLYMRRSSDNGKTWGPSTCCIPADGYYVTNNDRVIRLSSGRLLAPANFHRLRKHSIANEKEFWAAWIENRANYGMGYFYLSDDDGKSWREARQHCVSPVPRSILGLQETGVVELKNGIVWAWFRTNMGYQYQSFSHDGGESWSPAQQSLFRSERSPMSVKRIGGGKYLMAVWNPAKYRESPSPNRSTLFDRNPLVYALSADEGQTWSEAIHIEDDTEIGFSYSYIYDAPGVVLVAYYVEKKHEKLRFTRSLRITRFTY